MLDVRKRSNIGNVYIYKIPRLPPQDLKVKLRSCSFKGIVSL